MNAFQLRVSYDFMTVLHGKAQPRRPPPGQPQRGAAAGPPTAPGLLRPRSIRASTLAAAPGISVLRTVLAPLQSKVLHTSWLRRWLPRGPWLGQYRLGGQPGPRRASPAPGRTRHAAPPGLATGQTDLSPHCLQAYLRLSPGGWKAGGLFCVDLVGFQLAFVGDGEPRALIWMTDRINSDSFASIPGV